MFQETKREFNGNLRVRLVDNFWILERKIGFLWFQTKDDRGKKQFTGISDAVIALSRIAGGYGRRTR
ncbi:MAG: hypothetical protein P8130_01470 [Deltaproteobacteria bacterium]